MKNFKWFLIMPIFVCLLIMVSGYSVAEDVSVQTTEPLFIYQRGRVISISPNTGERINTIRFSAADFIPNVNQSALWTAYDKNKNRVYMIVEREPFNFHTGKQLRSMVALDLTNAKEEILYTDNNLQRGALSPDGTKLLIHQYKIGDLSTRPTGSRMCILSLESHVCQTIDLEGVATQFSWINQTEFIVPLHGLLYVCNVDKISCESEKTLQDIYVDSVITTKLSDQILIAVTLRQPSYDGIMHFFNYDRIAHTLTEIEQLRKIAAYYVDVIDLSSDGKYPFISQAANVGIVDVSTGTQVTMFQGFKPQWLGDSDTLIDTSFQKNSADVYTLDVENGNKTTLYTTNQPFNLMVP